MSGPASRWSTSRGSTVRLEPPPELFRAECPSPFGTIVLLASARGLRRVVLPRVPRAGEAAGEAASVAASAAASAPEALAPLAEQVQQYLAGARAHLDWPLDLVGPPFALRVWEAARRIPYGTTVTYAELAAALGHRGLARAVGRALARNPVPLFVPCHRVVATGGSLGGFSAGLPWKRWLLALEEAASAPR